jgi:hypothetical protein
VISVSILPIEGRSICIAKSHLVQSGVTLSKLPGILFSSDIVKNYFHFCKIMFNIVMEEKSKKGMVTHQRIGMTECPARVSWLKPIPLWSYKTPSRI